MVIGRRSSVSYKFPFEGFEVHGEENLPASGALIIGYHGPVVYDMFYMASKRCLLGGRVLNSIVDRLIARHMSGVSEV